MADTNTNWILNLVDRVTGPLKKVTRNTDKATQSGNRLGDCFKRIRAIDFYAVGEGIQSLNDMLQDAVQPGVKFQSGLADVEAITGVTGDALVDLGKKARASAKTFGGQASESLDTYKTILSRLGPDIAKSPEALEKMEHSVRTLSKTMGGDATASVDALTTAMLQYGVDLSDPVQAQEEMAKMMNVMAAGAKEGAAEVPGISQALKVAGVQAKQSGLSFEESNAALQALAAGGREGAEAGTALRNVLAKTAGEDIIPANAAAKLRALGVDMDVVSDTTLPFTDRLRELKKAQSDATVISQVFGVENAASANILLDSVDAQDKLTQKITGTNTATEQADVVMNTFAERMSRMKARMADFGISVFNATESFLPFLQAGGQGLFIFSQLGTVFKGLGPLMSSLGKKGLGSVTKNLRKANIQAMLASVSFKGVGVSTGLASAGTWTLTGSVKALGAAIKGIPVIGWILAIVGALITLFAYLWNNSEKFRGFIYGTWNAIKIVFGKIWEFISPILDWIGEKLAGVFSGIWETTKSVFSSVWNFLKGIWTGITDIIGKALDWINDTFGSIFGGLWDSVKEVFKGIWETIKKYLDMIMKPIKAVGGFLAKIWDGVTGSDIGKEIAAGYEEGYKRADDEIETDAEKKEREAKEKKEAEAKAKEDKAALFGDMEIFKDPTATTEPKGTSPTKTATGGGDGNGLAIAGGGKSGGGKRLNMTLNVTNNFSVGSGTNIRQLADEIVGYINDNLRDAAITLG